MSMPEKKAAVFRAVLHLLRQGRPLGDLKVSEIAEAAGIGKGTVYEYFPSREELLRDAWGYASPGDTRTVDVHVQRLRKKLGFACIETVYRLGYKLRAQEVY